MTKTGLENANERAKRVKVGLTPEEYESLNRMARSQNRTLSECLRSLLLKENENENVSAISHAMASEIENHLRRQDEILKIILLNTALARGHATATLERAGEQDREVLQKRMVEARDLQKKIFFDLFPALREGQS